MSATILPFVRPPVTAMMSLHASVPETAMTAGLLGTSRESHAVQVNEEGLLLTVGYSVLEASELWVTNRRGQTSEAIVLAQDFNSGLALVKPTMSVGQGWLETAPLNSVNPGDQVNILTSDTENPMEAMIFAKDEFAGRWEYLLEEALYTTPLCEHWSGAALLNADGRLCGIGSLALGMAGEDGEVIPGNLFIPTELVTPYLEHLQLYGETPGEKRPWLGILTEEHDSELHVIGVYTNAPAANAGIQPGEIILAVQDQPVSSLASFFRRLWQSGPAGTEIPLTVRSGDQVRDVVLQTTDRNSFFIRHESRPVS